MTALCKNKVFLACLAAALAVFAFAERPALKKVFEKDFYIGAALSHDQIAGKDAAAMALVEEQFNSVTSENILKWNAFIPS